MAALAERLEFRDRGTWFDKIDDWKQKFPFAFRDDSEHAKPQYVIEELHRQTNGEAIITTGRRPAPDVGRPALPLALPAPDDHERRPGHDGLWPAVGPWARSLVPPARSSSTSTATPATS